MPTEAALIESLGVGFATGVAIYGAVFGAVAVIRLFRYPK